MSESKSLEIESSPMWVKARRERIATAAMTGAIKAWLPLNTDEEREEFAELCCKMADTLIAQLDSSDEN